MLLALGKIIARIVYRVTSVGAEKLPAGGFLLLPNHVTWVDAIVLQIACPRPIRFMVYEPIYNQPALNWLFRLIKAIPISPRKAKEAMREAAERIRQGEVVCIFPEGELSRTGILLRIKRGYEIIAREADAPVVPVWLDQLWGSIFSFYGGKYFKKIPRKFPYPVMVAFGEPIPHDRADIMTVRERMLALGETCYQQRPLLRGHLAEASLRGLKHRQFGVAIIDGMDHSTITRGTLLAASIALSRHLKKHCANKRIATVLPTGKAAVIANLAVMLAGKVPVNLNFTAGNAALEAAMRIADLDDAITATAFAKKLPDFPFPKNVIHLEKVMPGLKKAVVLWRVLVFLLPWRVLAWMLGLPSVGDREEAVVLFTSGSSGEPKGVVLSHRNILGNVSQFSTMLNLDQSDAILASLPFFHSFGCTVTLWYPILDCVRLVTYPNPIEVVKNAELIERYGITMLLATPTFLRSYLRRVEPKQLASLKIIVTGAEKLPDELAAAFQERFGKEVLQGYGLTETAPVASVNLPEPEANAESGKRNAELKGAEAVAPQQSKIQNPKSKIGPPLSVQPSNRLGSVGKLAPGIAAQIRDPDTGAVLSLQDSGMLWLRGPNIFEGYLNDPKRTAEVLHGEWFKTGDLARFDEDGFLFIEGRLSRFSKIGGEMVPHETLESKISEVLALKTDDRAIAVTGIPDESKGEALVVLSTQEIDVAEMRAKLSEAGVPNLWIPKRVQRVEQIPVLGSGKLDLKACKEMAMAG